MKRHLLSTAATFFAVILLATAAGATSISVGSSIPVSATTIAVPVEITDGHAVIGWQFDLSYDPTDLQVNTGCDPFSGDIYCSLITGPVTEGDFFASGAPFNLLVPGFVNLDPITLNQTGLLFGVAGTFGGSPPYPSGDGTLAFVEFTIIGNGQSQVRVVNSSIDTVAVPEPSALLLLLGGLPFVRSRRSSRLRFLVLGTIAAAGILFWPHAASAQTTAVGPYYATPSWDQTFTCTTASSCPRFVVLSNFNNEAVLDRETGLVWQRSTPTDKWGLAFSAYICLSASIGGHQGWRLPRADELMSLGDPTNNDALAPHLPPGHPFQNVSAGLPYWVIDHTPANFPDSAMVVSTNLFQPGFSLVNSQNFNDSFFRLCVRGGTGAATR
jgi:hypothetical protein